MNNIKVSIVVTTKNEQNNIANCLKSIRLQTYREIELIVIDNFSTDNTVKIASNYTSLVYSHGPERSSQRNFGLMQIATGTIGAYIDADMILSPNLVAEVVNLIDEKTSGIYIDEIILGKSYLSKIRNFERQFYGGTSIDAVRFFPLKIFKKIGGFDEELFRSGSGEDWDLNNELEFYGEFKFLPKKYNKSAIDFFKSNFNELSEQCDSRSISYTDVVYHNESNLSYKEYLEKKLYYARAFSDYQNKWRGNKNVKRQFSLFYRYFWVFFEHGKWRNFKLKPYLFFLILFYKIPIGVIYLVSKNSLLGKK